MYAASKDFHNAVAAGKHQLPLLIFKDLVFTDKDIDVDAGIEFDDYFNTTEDLSIGQALTNEIRFTLFNDDKLLNKYEFGEFTATLGVMIGTKNYNQFSPVKVITGFGEWQGFDDPPYLRRDGTALPVQPNFAVKSLLGYDGKVWAFSRNQKYVVYDDKTGANITSKNPVNKFMLKKSTSWNGKGYYYNPTARMLFIYDAGVQYRYEFVPLGVFIADRPNVPDQIRIDMTCHNRMMKFEKDFPGSDKLGITYPTTIKNIFTKICNYYEVPYKTASFVNGDATVDKEPEAFSNATTRIVIGWIAEIAGSNARFDRDGKLILDWVHDTGTSLNENGYIEFKPYWYETKKINKLYDRATDGRDDRTYGTGNNGYLIQDNPFL